MKFETSEFGPDVHLARDGSKLFFVIGTAHVSKDSADLVKRVIDAEKPTAVCVELCPSRYQSIIDESRWKNTDIIEVIRTGKTYVLLVQLALASFQKQMATKFGVRPGEEMHVAIAAAKDTNAELVLADRDVKTTLRRAWWHTSAWEIAKLFFSSLKASFSRQEIREIDIMEMKSGDLLSEVLGELGTDLPGVKTALIDERDLYLTTKIRSAAGEKVVAVVGAGHIPGIQNAWEQEINLEPLEIIPPSTVFSKIAMWGIPVSILGLMFYGMFTAGVRAGAALFARWALITGSLSAIGGIISLAHPLTIITAFLCAPLTTLHPAVSAGTVCGLVEAFLRRPQVKDFETVSDDCATIRGMWTNRVSRVLLVFLLTSAGAAIGTFVGAGSMIAHL